MKAVIVNFIGGPRTRIAREAVVRLIGECKGSLVGRKATWLDPRSGARFVGKVVDVHGRGGYRVRFRRGLPGWALGGEVEIA